MLKTKDGQTDLVELTGQAGAALLEDVTTAVDELAAQGVIAKEAEETAEQETPPAEPVNLNAMKQTIDRVKQQSASEAADETSAAILALRDAVAAANTAINALSAEIIALREAQSGLASKEASASALLTGQVAEIKEHNDKADAVLAGLYDLILGPAIGTKEVVIERNGNGSVHDPDGVQLAKQLALMGAGNGTIKPGEYAGAQLFGAS